MWFHGFFGPDHFVVFNQVFLIDALWGMSLDIILSIANSGPKMEAHSAPKMEAHNGRPFVQVLLSQCLRFFSLGSTRLQNGRPQDMAKVCFGMLGAKTLWTPCGVKMRVRKGSSSGSMEVSWGKNDRIISFGIVSLGWPTLGRFGAKTC